MVSWKPSKDDGGSPVTHYIVEKRESYRLDWSHVDRVKATESSITVPYLTENAAYYIRVLAENVAGISEPLQLKQSVTPKSPYGMCCYF